MRHGFVIVFLFVFDSNFRPEDGDQDAPWYNGYLFQRGREQERNPQPQPQPAYPPYPYYLTGNPRIPLQYVPEPAPRSCSPMPGRSEPSAGISQAETCGEKGEKYRRTDVLGFVKIPKRLSTKTPGIYSFCPGQNGRDFLFEKIKKCFLNGRHNYKSNCSSYSFRFYR